MDFGFQWKSSPLSFFLGECKHKIIGLWLKMHSSSNHLVRIRKSVMSIRPRQGKVIYLFYSIKR